MCRWLLQELIDVVLRDEEACQAELLTVACYLQYEISASRIVKVHDPVKNRVACVLVEMLDFFADFLRLILTIVLDLTILGYLDWFLWELVAVVFGKHEEDAA